MVHLHVDQCLPHAIVEGEDGRIIEDDINHFLELVCTLGKEEPQFSSQFKFLEVLCSHPIFEPMGN